MSESLSALYLQNPQLAIALRRRLEAEQQMKEGTSGEPIRSPWQGVNRLAQGLIGGYQAGQQDKAIQDTIDADKAEVADFQSAMAAALMNKGQPGPAAPATTPAAPATPMTGGGSGSYADRVIGAESGGNPNARNPMSSATGAGQFIDSTWLSMMNGHPAAAGKSPQEILALRSDPNLSREMVDKYAQQNAATLAAQGLPANDATQYLAHWFGPGGASAILKAPPGTPMSAVMPPEVLKANPNIANMTTDGVMGLVSQKMGSGRVQMASLPPAATDAGSGGDVPRETPAAPGAVPQPPMPPGAAAGPDQSALMQIYLRGLQSNNPRVQKIAAGLAPFIKQGDESKVLAPGAILVDRNNRVLARNENDPTTTRINLQNDLRAPGAYDTKRGETLGALAHDWDASWDKAYSNLNNISAFRAAMQGVQTGIGSGAKITLGQAGQRLGIPDSFMSAIGLDAKDTASLETIRSVAAAFLRDKLGKGEFPANNFSNPDREMLEKSLPGLQNSPGGNEIMLDIAEAAANRQAEIGRQWRAHVEKNGDSLESARKFQNTILPGIISKDIITPIFAARAPFIPGAPQETPQALPNAPRIRTWNPATGKLE